LNFNRRLLGSVELAIQNKRAKLAVKKQTAMPKTTGKTVATVVHFKLRVSCQIVKIVVLHGL